MIRTEPTAHPQRRSVRTDAAGRAGRQLLAALAGALLAACAAPPAAMACTVGSGMGTCTEAALVNCLPGGGSFDNTVVFNCGGSATIMVTSIKLINANTTIDGGGLITISGGLTTSIFTVLGATLNLQNLTIANANNGSGGVSQGGAITNAGTVTVTGCTFSNNASRGTVFARGGAILNQLNSSLFINNSTFINNMAVTTAPDAGNGFAEGGALHLTGGNGSTVITNSTFSGNSVSDTGPGSGQSQGGAIYNTTASKLTITNRTFVGNTASSDTSRGGAITQDGLGGQTTTITNCTFLGTVFTDGICFFNSGGNFRLTNTIVANTIASNLNCSITGAATIDDFGNNMEDGTSCGFK